MLHKWVDADAGEVAGEVAGAGVPGKNREGRGSLVEPEELAVVAADAAGEEMVVLESLPL